MANVLLSTVVHFNEALTLWYAFGMLDYVMVGVIKSCFTVFSIYLQIINCIKREEEEVVVKKTNSCHYH